MINYSSGQLVVRVVTQEELEPSGFRAAVAAIPTVVKVASRAYKDIDDEEE